LNLKDNITPRISMLSSPKIFQLLRL